jgi:hypothetical protein
MSGVFSPSLFRSLDTFASFVVVSRFYPPFTELLFIDIFWGAILRRKTNSGKLKF